MMILHTPRESLFRALKAVKRDVEEDTQLELAGICGSVVHECVRAGLDVAAVDDVLGALSEALIELGLNVAYPVPAPAWFRPDEKSRERLAYSMLPLWTGDYGHARIALLNGLIDHLHP